jgi:hypothetical protein
MQTSDNAREQVERDPQNDPRTRTHADEILVDRQPIVADRPRDEEAWPSVPFERRRSDRRRIERTGTDI